MGQLLTQRVQPIAQAESIALSESLTNTHDNITENEGHTVMHAQTRLHPTISDVCKFRHESALSE